MAKYTSPYQVAIRDLASGSVIRLGAGSSWACPHPSPAMA